MASPEPAPPLKVMTSNDGDVLVVAGSAYTEKEIVDDREQIVQRLHGAYLNLLDDMQEFQQQWDADPATAFADAAYEGVKAGGGDWGESIGDLFDKQAWSDLGGKIEKFAGQALDRLAIYSAQQYEDLRQSFEEGMAVVENADKTIQNWAWWQTVIDRQAHAARNYAQDKVDAAIKTIDDAKATVIDSATKAQKIYQHRDAILNLPNLLSEGDAKGVQQFIDTVLMDIDPQLAKAIKESGQFHIALELIADHDSVLNYLSYVSLMIEAVPPNFYAYMSAKFGIQLLLEVVLMVVTAIFTAGVGVAVRVSTLVARLVMASTKVAGVARRIQKAQAAIRAFARMIEDFMEAATDLHALGRKLVSARARGVTVKGKTKQTLVARKAAVKRDATCRLCGSSAHSTPRGRIGRVTYV